MSDDGYKVPLTKVKEIRVHPNADRLDIAVVYGFEVVAAKGLYKVGDEVLYVPIDSLIPQDLEDFLFPEDAKIKLHHHRVRQIRIRKFPSQGMLIDKEAIQKVYDFTPDKLEEDYAEKLGITKYEPPTRGAAFGPDKKRKSYIENKNFNKYTHVDNIKWYPSKFQEGDLVVYQEKIHGTNSRAGIVPFQASTLWKKILKFFRLTPKWDKCYGSHNVQLQCNNTGVNLYKEVFDSIDIFNKIESGEQVFGEIYGSGIQKNYSYGCDEGVHKFILFDVKVLRPSGNWEWLDPISVKQFAKSRGFDMVPEIYNGPHSVALMNKHVSGPSLLYKKQSVREGIVVKRAEGYDEGMGSKACLKHINPKYLDKEQTDFH